MNAKTKAAFDVLGLGCTAVDELVYVDAYPPADAKQPIRSRDRQCGGLTATALVAAARLGARCAYAGALGTDDASQFVRSCLEREHIDLAHVPRRPRAKPCRSIIIVGAAGHTRNIFFDTTDVLGADPHAPSRALIQSSRVLLLDRFGVPGMLRAAQLAQAAGIPRVGDFEDVTWPGFDRLFPLADHLIVSAEFARKVTGARTPAAAVEGLGSSERAVVVVTCGAAGCWYQGAGSARPQHQPAFAVKTVDTTGCGDVFHGAYAAALARGLPLDERIRIAAAAAALKATQPGGQAGIPRWRNVQAFLLQVAKPRREAQSGARKHAK